MIGCGVQEMLRWFVKCDCSAHEPCFGKRAACLLLCDDIYITSRHLRTDCHIQWTLRHSTRDPGGNQSLFDRFDYYQWNRQPEQQLSPDFTIGVHATVVSHNHFDTQISTLQSCADAVISQLHYLTVFMTTFHHVLRLEEAPTSSSCCPWSEPVESPSP